MFLVDGLLTNEEIDYFVQKGAASKNSMNYTDIHAQVEKECSNRRWVNPQTALVKKAATIPNTGGVNSSGLGPLRVLASQLCYPNDRSQQIIMIVALRGFKGGLQFWRGHHLTWWRIFKCCATNQEVTIIHIMIG